jgi:peptidoglycan/LPS O-acetylase OafA/YrhL
LVANVAGRPASIDTAPAVTAHGDRLVGLDGIRGFAALFVVLHHCYLMAFPTYPVASGPFGTGWLIYGQFAVVVFIVLSGFSLSVSPARKGWQLGGKKRFAIRRAWRILPPYWAALVFSLIIAWAVVPQPGEAVPNAKSVLTYGLLVQDLTGSPSPNGAFWSIAIEAQLYIVFPLLLLMVRRAGALAMVAAVTAMVAVIGILGPHSSFVDAFMRLTPQLGALFAVGILAAGVVSASARTRRIPWHWLAAATAAPVLVLIAVEGSEWTVRNFLWVDLALGPAIGCLLAGLVLNRPRWLVTILDTRPVRSLGSFSYSLYLIHAPIVVVVYEKLIAPTGARGLGAMLATMAIAVPLSVVAARLFAAVFELPFQRHRGFAALRTAMRARWQRLRGSAAEHPAQQLAPAVQDDHLLAPQVHPVDG